MLCTSALADCGVYRGDRGVYRTHQSGMRSVCSDLLDADLCHFAATEHLSCTACDLYNVCARRQAAARQAVFPRRAAGYFCALLHGGDAARRACVLRRRAVDPRRGDLCCADARVLSCRRAAEHQGKAGARGAAAVRVHAVGFTLRCLSECHRQHLRRVDRHRDV